MNPAESNCRKNRRSRLQIPLGERLNTRLASYAAAASAAGVGMLATATAANARIAYTPVYILIQPDSTLPLDLNHDGINDFSFVYKTFTTFSSAHFTSGAVHPAQAGNAILGYSTGRFGCHVVVARQAGDRIGAGSRFGPYETLFTARRYCFGFGRSGDYLGLEFTVHGQKHFGWARLNVQPFALTGYAYETVPGKGIRAGQTGPEVGDSSVPELYSAPAATATLKPATLGLLALGQLGLDVWRREKETAVGAT
jgi:hypothetical protein